MNPHTGLNRKRYDDLYMHVEAMFLGEERYTVQDGNIVVVVRQAVAGRCFSERIRWHR